MSEITAKFVLGIKENDTEDINEIWMIQSPSK